MIVLLAPVILWSQKRPIQIDDLFSIQRINDFRLSPDGEWIAYTAEKSDVKQNRINSDVFLVSSMGGTSRQLTTHSGYDGKPCWSPDGSLLAFISTRNGTPQIYVLPMEGGEARQISNIPAGIHDFIWSPEGTYFAFVSDVDPHIEKPDSTLPNLPDQNNVKIIDHMPYRYQDKWLKSKRKHIFIMPFSGGKVRDITPGDYDAPPLFLKSRQDFIFSPNGNEIAFVRNTDSLVTSSTNNDIFIVPSKGGKIRRITFNPANDNQPVYSPDGKFLAFRSMRRPGCGTDQYDLMIYNRKTRALRNLTPGFDLDIGEICWHPESDRLYFTSEDQGRIVIFSVEIKSGKIKGLVHQGCNTNILLSPDGSDLYFLRTTMNSAHEIFKTNEKGESLMQLTFLNSDILDKVEMNSAEDFWFSSYDNKMVHGFILKPPFFNPAKKYPVVVLIHEGENDSWKDEFHPYFTPQIFSSSGYVLLLINFRGSNGYGQEFRDGMTGKWGDAPYRDLLTGLEYALKKYPFLDENRMAAFGASFGGFMTNWINVHTNPFQCFVSHATIIDPASLYGTSETQYFLEWEFNGSPAKNSRYYDRWNPLRMGDNFSKPMLLSHGANDFLIPVDQTLQTFTLLQQRHIPSKVLYFSDEGHYINKPENIRFWWETVTDWINAWTLKEKPEQ